MTPIITELGTVLGAIAILAAGYYAFTKNGREARLLAITEADKTVSLLEKQNTILCDQLEHSRSATAAAKERWATEQMEYRRREDKLEGRIGELERDYRTLVLTVTTMGFCANAGHCTEYNPGDRREGMKG